MQPIHAPVKTGSRAFVLYNGWTLLKQYILTPALDLIFPPACVGCGRVDTLLCAPCTQNIAPPDAPATVVSPLHDVQAIGHFSGVLQKAVHALKYEHLTALARPLGELMAERIAVMHWPPSLIIPVPLHTDRLQYRGYNQAALLGQVIAEQLHWPWQDNVLMRVRATRSQVGLNYHERQGNVRGAFALAAADSVRGQDIVLVDDVYTTGATMRECAAVLLEDGGAHSVRAIVAGQAGIAGQR